MSSKSFFEEDDAAQANKFSKKAKESPFMLIGKLHERVQGQQHITLTNIKWSIHTHTHTNIKVRVVVKEFSALHYVCQLLDLHRETHS